MDIIYDQLLEQASLDRLNRILMKLVELGLSDEELLTMFTDIDKDYLQKYIRERVCQNQTMNSFLAIKLEKKNISNKVVTEILGIT